MTSYQKWPVLTAGVALLAAFFLFIEFAILIVQITPLPWMVWSWRSTPVAPVAIVLGASVKTPTQPSDALKDRLETAYDLYRSGRVQRILLTGDGGAFRSDEISVMRAFLQAKGLDTRDILVDTEGFRTYESCKRAKELFRIKRAVIITQRFHLARALFLCRYFDIDVSGLAADRERYRKRWLFALRELGASVKAVLDVYIHTPKPPVEVRYEAG